MKRLAMVCGTCGSKLVMRDAWAEWSEAEQQWVLGSIFDAGHCEDCEGETRIEEKEIVDGEPS